LGKKEAALLLDLELLLRPRFRRKRPHSAAAVAALLDSRPRRSSKKMNMGEPMRKRRRIRVREG